MPRVVIKGGVLIPIEPLPPDWAEGAEFDIDLAPTPPTTERNGRPCESTTESDWIDDEDYERMVGALAEADQIEKERMRREMGLP
jgi:hypothetical protein